MHKNGNEKNRCRQGCQLASTGACGHKPFQGRSRCHQELRCQNKYCVCKIQISCIREKSWFSHDSEFENGGSHKTASGKTQYLGMNSFLNIFY